MSECCYQTDLGKPLVIYNGMLTIALAGQPNMGKSTLFNLFTGLNQHVGNWPGKTVEKKEGVFCFNNHSIHIIDLPGTYSLTANSPEEMITREYILREKPDLLIAVVSAANLERSLYLVSELIVFPTPLIVALNMMDVAKQEGIEVDTKMLEAGLGVPVVPMTATHPDSARELLSVVDKYVAGEYEVKPRKPDILGDQAVILKEIENIIEGSVPQPYPLEWTAVKLLEGDSEMIRLMQENLCPDCWEALDEILKANEDAMLAIASKRYEWIERMIRAAVNRPRLGQLGLTDRLDRWATHPIFGLVILAMILGMAFWLTFSIGTPIQDWLDTTILSPFSEFVRNWLSPAPAWFRNMLVDGIIGGVGSVLTFLPIIMIFFATFGLLEDIGYMARAAYVMDNFMHWMGLHGKSFLPLFLGFGCNVPAVMGTRVIESVPARLLTILLAPIVPCTARMAVIAFLAPAFFGSNAAWISWGMILGTMIILIITGTIINRIIFKGERTAFVMELPLYHIPNWRSTLVLVWQRSLAFIKKAGTIILLMSVFVWIFSTLPDGNLETSYLSRFGQLFEPVGHLLGLDWRLTVALLTSFLAKENSVATLGVLFGTSEGSGLAQTIASTYSPAVALSFLTISLLFIPCAATVAVIRQETGSWRWTFANIGLMLILSFVTAFIVFHLATFAGL